MADRDRFETGTGILKQIGGVDYAAPLEALKEVAPDLVRFTVEFAYGEVMSRPVLDLKTRQLVTVAALAALARTPAQLRFHISGALNVGCIPEHIVEVFLLTAVYAGFPAALNALTAAKEIYAQRGIRCTPVQNEREADRYARGMRVRETVHAHASPDLMRNLGDIAPDLGRFVVEFCYGDVVARSVLTPQLKALCIVASLTAMATAQPQLKVHIRAALNVGATREEVIEVIQQMAVYAGFPAALNGIGAAKQVFAADEAT